MDGKIVHSGDVSVAAEIEAHGYDQWREVRA
jgi:Fe-S cluster assembly ATPase SufC